MGSKTAQLKQAAGRVGCTVEEWLANTASGMLWCYCCRSWIDAALFGNDRSRSRGKASACKKCVSHKGTASRYKIPIDVARGLRNGDKKCDICGRTQKLEVDHDHGTGAVRGVLCSRCNGALGQFCDSEELLKKAIAYLQDHS